MRVPGGLKKAVKIARNILVITHEKPDGDAIGSTLGLTLALRYAGKKAGCIFPGGFPPRYSFLLGGSRSLLDGAGAADITFVLDCADESRASGMPLEGDGGTVINVDHHPGNALFGVINMVDPKASSTAELVEKIITGCGLLVKKRTAECLLVGLYSDTGSFQHDNTSPEVFRLAARLVECGASPSKVTAGIYRNKSGGSVRLLGRLLSRTRRESKGRLAWSYLKESDYEETGTAETETEDFIDNIRCIEGVKISVFFRVRAGGHVRVSLRSVPGFRVNRIASAFKGGGHVLAAGCTVDGGIESARRRILGMIKRDLLM